MARVEINLNGHAYAVACEDGQEQRLNEVVSFVDQRMRALAGGKAFAAETQLLVLTTLTLADQIFDLRTELAKARTHAAQGAGYNTLDPVLEEKIALTIESLAERIDSVASKLTHV